MTQYLLVPLLIHKKFSRTQLFAYFYAINKQHDIAMQVPETLKYTKDHEWVRIEGNVATIGITDFAQHELGDIVYVEINGLNKELGEGEVFGTVEAVKTVSDLFLPVAGTVTEVNPELESNPEFVNQDPFGKGWMVKMTLSNAADADNLMDATAYSGHIGA